MQKIKRLAALIGAVLLILLYLSTLFFALSQRPEAQYLLMASIVCTVLLPVLLYAMTLMARVLGEKKEKEK